MELDEIYAITYHENHPIRRKLIGAMIEAGMTEEQIKTSLPGALKTLIVEKGEKSTDTDLRAIVARK
jgi:hypothetical protein